MKKAVEARATDTQRRDGHACCFKGSWDPPSAWDLPGGRVAGTALHTLALQVFYRYVKLFGTR